MLTSDFLFFLTNFVFWEGAGAGAQSGGQPGSPKMKFSKHSHVIYRRKAFLMLISDFGFVLPDFDFWGWGRGSVGVSQGSSKMKFSKYSHVLILIFVFTASFHVSIFR